MGNNFTKDVGDVQEGVGRASGTVGVGIAYFMAVIFGILAIGFLAAALIPISMDSGFTCGGKLGNNCPEPEKCINGQCQGPKKRHPWFLVGTLIFILFAVGIVLYAKWYNSFVHESRVNAQIGGTLTEIEMMKQLFS